MVQCMERNTHRRNPIPNRGARGVIGNGLNSITGVMLSDSIGKVCAPTSSYFTQFPITSTYTDILLEGNVEYEWEGAPTVNEHQRTPRTEAPIEQLTTGFETLNVNSTSYNHDQGAAYSNQSALPVDNASKRWSPSLGI
jgi:hypothetical protein